MSYTINLPCNMLEEDRAKRNKYLFSETDRYLFEIEHYRVDDYYEAFKNNLYSINAEYLGKFTGDKSINDIDMMYIYHHYLGDNFGIEDRGNYIYNQVRKIRKDSIIELCIRVENDDTDCSSIVYFTQQHKRTLTPTPLPLSVVSNILTNIEL